MKRWVLGALALGALILGLLVYDDPDIFTAPLKPVCERGIADAKVAFENGPLAKTFNVKILDVSEPRQIESTGEETKCAARALLNNGTEFDVEYRFFMRNGRPFVETNVKF